MKRYFALSILALAAILPVSCRNDDSSGDVLIEGTVVDVDTYGGLYPSFSPQQLADAGVEYGDLLTVSVGDSITVTAPYVDAYTEAGSMSPCICNYNDAGINVSLCMSNGSFAGHVGGREGDSFVVRMKKKGGYEKEYELLKGTYSYERSDYPSDEAFANFRPMATSGLKPGVLYRGTSPISFKNNKVRYVYTDSLCHKYGIKTIVDIADSDEKVRGYLNSEEYGGFYMKECLDKDNIIGLGSNADYIDSVFMSKLSRGLRAMLEKPAPYLIHCNEGKDRTGFYCMLLEAFCGATLQEMKADYMRTFENLYHQKEGMPQYELTWHKNGLRMLYQIAHPEKWGQVVSIDWDKISVEGADLAKAAENYIIKAGLSADEVRALRETIGTAGCGQSRK